MILNYGDHKPRKPGVVNVDLFAHPNVDYVVEAGGVLPFDDETFDMVISNQVMEHNFFIEEYYREAARVLKSHGYMYLHFPHRWQPYDGHFNLFCVHWFYNPPGFNWKSRGYHKQISKPYFPIWLDMAPYWRQVRAMLFKRGESKCRT